MRLLRVILIILALAVAPMAGRSAEATGTAPAAEQGVSPKPLVLGRIGAFPITNSMVMSWVVALGLIVFAQVATRNMQLVPVGAQNFCEWLVESLHDFLEGIIGPALVKRTFWFFASVFIFILFSNWFGLIPFVGTVGYQVKLPDGTETFQPWFRGVNSDLNMTMGMALVFFACWFYWALQSNGPIGFLKHLFAPKGETTGALKVLMVAVFFAVGFLEILSILFRPISLSFRLYGNIYAGENMLDAMQHLVPGLGWLLPVPFYFMELLVGIIQAMVFMLLTAVFTMLIMPHDEDHEKAHH